MGDETKETLIDQGNDDPLHERRHQERHGQ